MQDANPAARTPNFNLQPPTGMRGADMLWSPLRWQAKGAGASDRL